MTEVLIFVVVGLLSLLISCKLSKRPISPTEADIKRGAQAVRIRQAWDTFVHESKSFDGTAYLRQNGETVWLGRPSSALKLNIYSSSMKDY